MKRLCQTLTSIIEDYIMKQEVLCIDHLFGKFALDVIYNIGFEIDDNFMHNEDAYNVSISSCFCPALSRFKLS